MATCKYANSYLFKYKIKNPYLHTKCRSPSRRDDKKVIIRVRNINLIFYTERINAIVFCARMIDDSLMS